VRSYAASAGAGAIHVLDLKTRQVSLLPGSERLYSPRWSPDGRYIVAITGGQGPEVGWLRLFDFTTKKWTGLTRIHAAYENWSRDGKYVYFQGYADARRETAIYRVRISDGKQEQVVGLKGFRQETGFVGVWSGLAPDDAPLLLHGAGSEDIYALEWEAP
jgi:Tol biopolymer transport system component